MNYGLRTCNSTKIDSSQGYKPVGLVDWLDCQLDLKLVSGLEGWDCLHLKYQTSLCSNAFNAMKN